MSWNIRHPSSSPLCHQFNYIFDPIHNTSSCDVMNNTAKFRYQDWIPIMAKHGQR